MIDKSSLVSVIVPIYKVEDFLDRCIESIINQTYANIEIILVDDGSPDGCGKKCEDWKKKDNRILVFHKENGGLSDARNYGTQRASGDYIVYIDSDDWVSRTYIENLYLAIEKEHSDLAMCWYEKTYKYIEPTINRSLENYCSLSVERCLTDLLYQNFTDTCAWGKMYSKQLFGVLDYPVGKLYEDIPVTYAAILNSKKIARINNKEYFYFQRNDSIQHMHFDDRKLDAIKHIKEMTDDIKNRYPVLTKACDCRKFSVLNNILFQINKSSENAELINEIWNDIKKIRRNVLTDKEARNKARVAALLSYGGYNVLEFAYRKFNK